MHPQQSTTHSLNRLSVTDHVSPLLALPAELRNRIYELVLYRHFDLQLTDAIEPSLLKVSRQLRREGREIFYDINTFIYSIKGLFPTELKVYELRFGDLIRNITVYLDAWWIHEVGARRWSNTFRWLEIYFKGRFVISRVSLSHNGRPGVLTVGAAAFDMVTALKQAGVTWDVAEKVLLAYKEQTHVTAQWT